MSRRTATTLTVMEKGLILDEMTACRNDPARFNATVLGRGGYWSKQREICASVVEHPVTLVPTGNVVGKTYVDAGFALVVPLHRARVAGPGHGADPGPARGGLVEGGRAGAPHGRDPGRLPRAAQSAQDRPGRRLAGAGLLDHAGRAVQRPPRGRAAGDCGRGVGCGGRDLRGPCRPEPLARGSDGQPAPTYGRVRRPLSGGPQESRWRM